MAMTNDRIMNVHCFFTFSDIIVGNKEPLLSSTAQLNRTNDMQGELAKLKDQIRRMNSSIYNMLTKSKNDDQSIKQSKSSIPNENLETTGEFYFLHLNLVTREKIKCNAYNYIIKAEYVYVFM